MTFLEDSTKTPTGTTTTGSFVITALSSNTGIFPGMAITGTGIPANTFIILVGSTTLTLTNAATGNHTSESLTISGSIQSVPQGGTAGAGAYYYQVTYEWTDNQGLAYRSAPSIPVAVTTTGASTTASITITVPMLRLTSKVVNPVKIVIYRWSEFTQVYNQVTSIAAPVLNDTNAEEAVFVDTLSDSAVIEE